MVHREHRVGLAHALGHEERIGRDRPLGVDAGGERIGNRRRDRIDVLTTHVSRLPAMGIQARDQDARTGDAEAPLQIGIEHA